MFREQRTLVIDRPVHEVFAYVSDFDNDRHWRGELIELEHVGGTPGEVGACYRQRIHWEGREMDTTFELDSFEPDHAIAFHGEAPGIQAKAAYRFEPLREDRTRLHVTAEIETFGAMKIVEPFVWGLLRRQGEQDLHTLKQVLEQRLVHA